MAETLNIPVLKCGVDKQNIRNAMARLPATVNVVTTDGPAGQADFTASAVCSVTDKPPMLLVRLNRCASVYQIFNVNRQAGHEPGALFGGKTAVEDRFVAAEWSTLVTGSPVLGDAVPHCNVSEAPHRRA